MKQFPEWLEIAALEIGQTEIPGRDHNARILEYHQATTLKATDDETPWCSSFVSWVMLKAQLPSTMSAAARSWLRYGVSNSEQLGSIVIFSRPTSNNPMSGHVGFLWWSNQREIIVLGGNQNNSVTLSPYRKSQLLGVRWPSQVPLS